MREIKEFQMYDPMHVNTVTWLTTDMYMDKWLSEYTNIKMKIKKTIYLLKYVHIFVKDLDVMCNVIISWTTETRKSIFYCSTRETLWYILYSGKYLHLHVHVYMYYFKITDKAKHSNNNLIVFFLPIMYSFIELSKSKNKTFHTILK